MKPKFINCLRMRCLYCGKTKLLKEKSWFDFGEGCNECDYRYEREAGYYTGASWLINFPVTSVLAFVLGAYLYTTLNDVSSQQVALAVSFFIILFGIAFFPWNSKLFICWSSNPDFHVDGDFDIECDWIFFEYGRVVFVDSSTWTAR